MKKKLFMFIFIFFIGISISTPAFATSMTCHCYNDNDTFDVLVDDEYTGIDYYNLYKGKNCAEICDLYSAESSNGSTTLYRAGGYISGSKDNIDTGEKEEFDCGILSEITYPIYKIILIMTPILLLLLGSIDFTKAVAAGEEKAMKKAVSDFGKRLIIAIAILILPVIVNMVMGWIKFQDLSACLSGS